jgi:septal ring factor EnvC (AmiA/AmiB activator)
MRAQSLKNDLVKVTRDRDELSDTCKQLRSQLKEFESTRNEVQAESVLKIQDLEEVKGSLEAQVKAYFCQIEKL